MLHQLSYAHHHAITPAGPITASTETNAVDSFGSVRANPPEFNSKSDPTLPRGVTILCGIVGQGHAVGRVLPAATEEEGGWNPPYPWHATINGHTLCPDLGRRYKRGMGDEPQTPWTIGRLLTWTTGHFDNHGLDEPRLSAEILLAHALRCPRIQLYTRFDNVPDETVLAQFRDTVRRAAQHVPIAYLVGFREFFSLEFEVTADVLIPRPETETLVDRAIGRCRGSQGTPSILDLGTGSGCIIVTILANCTRATGVATDISAGALDVARRNAGRHEVADRIRFVEAADLSLSPDVVPQGGFDLIVSNPPYVSEADMATLPPNVRDHEPTIALTPGGDGLALFRVIASGATSLLKADGAVLVEIGAGQRDDVAAVFAGGGALVHSGTFRAPSDPHDRVMQFTKV